MIIIYDYEFSLFCITIHLDVNLAATPVSTGELVGESMGG